MPKTVQIREIDDAVYAALSRHAGDAGVTVPELLRQEVIRIAARPTVQEWLSRTRRRHSDFGTTNVTEALDELRGPWPHDRR